MLQAQGVSAILDGGQLRVSGPDGSLTLPFDAGFPTLDGGDVLVRATIGPQDANFEWAQREVLTSSGVVLDVESQDLGRKVAGMVWTLDVRLVID